MKTGFFELYANGKTVIPIGNCYKLYILKALKEGDKSFSGLVKMLKKPKSTVSTLLDDLEKDEIITSYKDKKDTRKKYYKIKGFAIASTENIKAQKEEEPFEGNLDDPIDFMNALFRSLRSMLGSFGMDTEPMIKAIGEKVGHEVAKKISSNDPTQIIKEVNDFFTKHKLGKVQLYSTEPFMFVIADCYGCNFGRAKLDTLYAFNEGILKSVFEDKLNKSFVVQNANKEQKTSCRYVTLV